jgi:hypothetical protein
MVYNTNLSLDEINFLKSKKIVRNNIINYKKDLVDKLDNYCEIYNLSFNELIYIIINKIEFEPKCLNCNSIRPKFISTLSGFKKYCSNKCSNSHYLVKNKKESVYLEKWGVDNPSKSQEIKDKLSIIGKSQSEKTKQKRKETCISKWGYETNLNLPEIKEKVKISLSKKEVKEKRENTCLDRWGHKSVFSSSVIKEKIKNTNTEKFGYEYPLQSEEIREKFRITNLEKWGVDNPSKSEEVKQKRKETFFLNWGVDHPTKTDEIKEKIKETTIKNWGVDSPMKSDVIKEKTRITNLEKWGTTNNTSSDIFRRENFKISKDTRYVKYLGDGFSLFCCEEGHIFELNSDIYSHRDKDYLCHICSPKNKSRKEINLYEYICSIYNGEIVQSHRDGLEIDIYLPELKMGIEFNGLYWHSELFKQKNYHLDKKNYFKERGIRIIYIWEDDWDLKKDIIKSQIVNAVGLTSEKIGARNCKIVELNSNISNSFLSQNHIQGGVRSNVRLGLLYNNELVSVMTFDNLEGRNKMEEGGWNLSRFSNKINLSVNGSASKLLSYFIKNWNPKRIISYADKDWSIGDLYYKIGFQKLYETGPDYKYLVDNKRIHKSNFKKSKLKTSLTEKQEMSNSGILRIYDSGKIKFQIEIN